MMVCLIWVKNMVKADTHTRMEPTTMASGSMMKGMALVLKKETAKHMKESILKMQNMVTANTLREMVKYLKVIT